jgi:hypothetical protein
VSVEPDATLEPLELLELLLVELVELLLLHAASAAASAIATAIEQALNNRPSRLVLCPSLPAADAAEPADSNIAVTSMTAFYEWMRAQNPVGV